MVRGNAGGDYSCLPGALANLGSSNESTAQSYPLAGYQGFQPFPASTLNRASNRDMLDSLVCYLTFYHKIIGCNVSFILITFYRR